MKSMGRILLCLAALLLGWQAHATPAVALYYGAQLPWELKAFDIVVVEPDHGHDPGSFNAPGHTLYAYVSVAEVQATRGYYKDIPAAWKLARNGHWDSDVIDQTPAEWPAFFADRVVAPLWQRGYRGFFLDTLDSYRLAQSFDEAAQQDGLVRVIETLHTRFPGIQLIANRGFDVAPRVPGKIAMVAAESLYRSWNAGARRYEEVQPSDREWLLDKLQAIRQSGVPVLVIDYAPPHERALARETAAKIQAHGFIPWITDSALSSVGVGSVEVQPRRILMLYDSGESPALNYANAHRYAQMPLNHLGYVLDYADVRQPLPEGIWADRYAGVAGWFSGFVPEGRVKDLNRWLQARVSEGMPLALVGGFGSLPDRALAFALGLDTDNGAAQGHVRITQQHAMMGFETPLQATARQMDLMRITPKAAPAATVLLELQDTRGKTFTAGALLPWGGFILDPYAVVEVPSSDQARWVIDPFAFFAQALRLPAMPVPDVTTENGRRLLFSHVDGDGFPSRAELPGSPLSGEVLLKEIFEKYRIPQTMSVIEAEVAPHGLHPDTSAQMEDIARAMFRLPHVQIASHTYSHPFRWDMRVRHGIFKDEGEGAKNYLALPGYQFNLEREIVGSVDYIRQRLAPAGKPVKILLWSGDTAPSAEALEITAKAELLNMNGGDTFISRSTPTLTAVGALGIRKKGYLQVYAATTNENIYTNLWHGPFYGYERVLETFEMTDKPRRLKPVNIYYHTYAVSKRAALNAMHKVYGWAMAQPLHPIHASDYIRKVQDFYSYVVAREGAGWRVRGNGALRTLRLPASLGLPVLESSQGVAGSHPGIEGRYVHLTGGAAWFATADKPAARPSLAQANARLDAFEPSADGRSLTLRLQGYVPLQFALAHTQGCQVRHGQKLLQSASSGNLQTYQLPDAAATIQIACPAR